ncbi:hypothetical protein NKI54_15715 [Mesorhizobium sp. M0663]|uniref:hypothetical protein n=1 Tax=unclassified Mesorhizobium TaxID=325217 RepID=UPI0033377205
MGDWADVYINGLDERLSLQRLALFYIPSALKLMSDNGITKSSLATFSMNIKGKPSAGRQAIAKVAECKPVVYDSAVGFVSAFNMYCERESKSAQLASLDIVACVFRLEGLDARLKALNVTVEALCSETKISAAVLASAINGFRVQLADALTVLNILNKLAEARTPPVPPLTISDFIVISPKLNRMSISKVSDETYVYSRYDLKNAPSDGHPWTIKGKQPERAASLRKVPN